MLKVQHRGLSEPHVFTIASGPQEGVLRFFIRDLGDWTSRLVRTDLAGVKVVVEGPYGRFEPTHADAQKTVWVAGGASAHAVLPTGWQVLTSRCAARTASLRRFGSWGIARAPFASNTKTSISARGSDPTSSFHSIGLLGVHRSRPGDTASKIWETLEMTEPLRLLTDDEITDALIGLPGWRRIDDKLHAGFSFHNFVAAFEFMTGVAGVAEELDHHPEWSNVYGSVTINLTNHDAGGITELDLEMAGRINTLAGRA